MNIKQEFNEFLQTEASAPPEALTRRILLQTERDLSVHTPYLFTKLLLIHLAVGAITLIFCPQFGVGPLGGNQGLAQFTMRYGPIVCAILCGSIFLGSSALVISWVMTLGELKVLRRHLLGYYSLMAGVSAGILLGLNQILTPLSHYHLSVPFLSTWLASAVLTATALTALIAWTRKV